MPNFRRQTLDKLTARSLKNQQHIPSKSRSNTPEQADSLPKAGQLSPGNGFNES